MTQCTKCRSCQILENEAGQPAIFCYRCGGPVEVVSDELPFSEPPILARIAYGADIWRNATYLKVYTNQGKLSNDALVKAFEYATNKHNEETNTNAPPGVGGM